LAPRASRGRNRLRSDETNAGLNSPLGAYSAPPNANFVAPNLSETILPVQFVLEEKHPHSDLERPDSDGLSPSTLFRPNQREAERETATRLHELQPGRCDPTPGRRGSRQVANMRALVIDDSRTVRLIVGKILTELGFEVTEAANGREGLDRLRQDPVELVLVDWNMPEVNGLDFIKAVRAQRIYDPVRLVMVTTEIEQDQVIRALDAGASEYVMKPFTREILVAKLGLLDIFSE
jgi:two-component system chemotaxis response regulator CheY